MKKETKDEQADALERLQYKVTQLTCYRLETRRGHSQVMREIISERMDKRGALYSVLHGIPE